jgi:hypothetical protein
LNKPCFKILFNGEATVVSRMTLGNSCCTTKTMENMTQISRVDFGDTR